MNRTRFGLALALLVVILCSPAVGAQSPFPDMNGSETGAELLSHGRYLAMIAGCNDCHTQGYLLADGKVPEGQWLTGSDLGWRGPWGTTYAVNLRLFLAPFSEDEWLALARQLRVRPPMPWYSLNVMRERDLKAIYRYIRSLGPAGKPAPAYLPPDQVPTTPYAQFPAPPPE
jgi:mono/diheme cytochrome c family protein